ncbi:MAG: hypothetical protein WCZ89_06155 [Phycisphaerae bacterium]
MKKIKIISDAADERRNRLELVKRQGQNVIIHIVTPDDFDCKVDWLTVAMAVAESEREAKRKAHLKNIKPSRLMSALQES